MSSEKQLSELAKTGFLPLWGRYFWHNNQNISYKDDLAEKMVHSMEFDFSLVDKHVGDYGLVAWGSRSLKFDQVINTYLEKYPKGRILSFGVGLDDPFMRHDNGLAEFWDYDFKGILEFRDHYITNHSRRLIFRESFLDFNWVEHLKKKNENRPLVLLSGVTMYLKEEEMKSLITEFFKYFPEGIMAFDTLSPYGVKMLNKGMEKSRLPQERVYFGTSDSHIFKEWVPELKISQNSLFENSLKNEVSLYSRIQLFVADKMKISNFFILGSF